MSLFKKILVAVDGSRYSLDAVCLAARLARFHGAELRIFHVIDDALLDQLSRFSERDREAVREELRNNAQAFLGDMRCAAHREVVPASEVIIREGIPHEIIIDEANTWGADLIVLGKLGRRGISHILIGSVAERVIEFADLPVLVVK
jgi:nucleotide-binding universal stress UspA family protein